MGTPGLAAFETRATRPDVIGWLPAVAIPKLSQVLVAAATRQ